VSSYRRAVQVPQRFRHPAEFVHEDLLRQFVAERVGPGAGPSRHALGHGKGLRVPAEPVHVEDAGHDLVDGVERRPNLVARLQPVPVLSRERAQVTVFAVLALGEHRHHRRSLVLQRRIARGGVRQRACGQEMPGEMPAQLAIRLLPPAERLGAGGQPCLDAEVVDQAIRRQLAQYAQVGLLGREEWAAGEAHGRHRKGFGFQGNGLALRGINACPEKSRGGAPRCHGREKVPAVHDAVIL